ncbi:MAG: UTP--glucose-1-phosphate uridylyltransferase, partial [Thermoplasmata archaeon]|nr:UTP--glucose-1-phosphate uridylyltransferase [Thermoplasmata archaeon]
MRIKKAVIPAAGLGTRLLPATKCMPKEMLPVVDKPAIHYVVEEAVQSGITDIIIVTGRGKRAIEDYFDSSPELESFLARNGQEAQLEQLERLTSLANICYVRQKEPRGLGNAILMAENHFGSEPFAILLGDDIISNKKPAISQLIDTYQKTGKSVIG